ncbi:MAG: arginine--tRNA ligase, partial [Pseudomonadota bacterium]
EPAGGDKETHIDGLINRAKTLLGAVDYDRVHALALSVILEDIRSDLEKFGVTFDRFFSERSLMDSGEVDAALQDLDTAGCIRRENDALWFRSSDFGDEKDRVVKRDNGQTTYFASDIAYARNKMQRGFKTAIYVWGADHHGYVTRVKAAATALGENADAIEIPLVQFAVLYKDGKKMQMSTRSGEFVTLRQLREDVGSDAARFFYVMRRCDQHLDFDLDLAVSRSNDNPMYYIQYAHARICSVQRQLAQKGFEYDEAQGIEQQALLDSEAENKLVDALEQFPEIVVRAAEQRAPHQLVNYLRELATAFHAWYNAAQFIVDDAALRNARIARCNGVKQVIANGLKLIGVSAPEEM